MRTFSIYVKTLSTSTLMQMKRAELVEYVRMCERNLANAYATLDQQAENFKKLLDEQPTADQWIPCSERPPEEPCIYTVEDCSPYTVNKHGEPQRRTIILKPFTWEPYHRVIAWKPINIEPYKGVE